MASVTIDASIFLSRASAASVATMT